MAAPVAINELSASGSLSAGAVVVVYQSNETVRTTPSAFITEAESFTRTETGAVARTPVSKMRDIISGEDFALPTNGTSDCTPAIQYALDAAVTRGGGTVWIRRNSSGNPYLLQVAGDNPYQSGRKYCLNINGNNVRLVLDEGVVLKLANGQQTDAGGAVHVLISRGRSRITITGGGRITGNTAGQTGWTGGYGQAGAGGNLIRLYSETGVSGMRDLLIEGLQLDDHFSNPIDFGFSTGTGRHARLRLRDLYSFDCGEGFQVFSADDVWIDRVQYEDASNVAVGDGIELSDVNRFYVRGCTVRSNGAGSAFDLFGARNGELRDFVVDSWADGLDVNTDGTNVPTNVIVANGVIKSCPGAGVNLKGGTFTNVRLANVIVQSAGNQGFQIAGDNIVSVGPVTLDGCEAHGCTGDGVFIKTITKLSINGGRFNGNTQHGIHWQGQVNAASASDTAELHITGVTATGNGAWGVNINSNGITGKEPTGAISNCMLLNNTSGALVISDDCIKNLNVEGITPSYDNNFVRQYDDFLGDVLADEWNTRVGTDPQCTAFAVLTNQARGLLQGITGDDAAASMAVNGVQIEGGTNWVPSTHGLVFEARARTGAITDICFFIGLTDQNSALEMPFTYSGTTLTSNATDAVGVLFDTDATTDNWKLVGVANDVDATVQDAGVAPVGGTFEIWKIVVSSTGQATFYRNGATIGSTMTGAVSTEVALCPVIAAFSRAAAQKFINVDYIDVRGLR